LGWPTFLFNLKKLSKTMRRIVKKLMLASLLALAVLPSCGNDDDDKTEPDTENENRPFMQIGTKFMDGVEVCTYNGTRKYTYEISEGHTATIYVDVRRTSGVLDVDVSLNGIPKHSIYEAETLRYDFAFDEPGKYEVIITADNFVGSFSVDYREK